MVTQVQQKNNHPLRLSPFNLQNPFTLKVDNSVFLGSVTTGRDPWIIEIGVGNRKMHFKIDTGADVTIIAEYVFNQAYGGNIPKQENAQKVIFDPGCVPLDVIGVSHMILQKERKHFMEQV